MKTPYPLTIVRTRYQGVYERGARWAAFNLEPHEVSSAAFADDVSCHKWWAMGAELVGGGDTPDKAVADLVDRLERHARDEVPVP